MYNILESLSFYLIQGLSCARVHAVGGMPVVGPTFRVSSIPAMTCAQFFAILFERSEGPDYSSLGTILISPRFSFTSQPGPVQRNCGFVAPIIMTGFPPVFPRVRSVKVGNKGRAALDDRFREFTWNLGNL